ncbi:Galactofuranosyl transferase GlfT2 [Microbacterium sp. 8M]|uniref:glycosyltransferase n=1 Tax=Microbacterium sp. 8M TaxID=2653153 RepID=UPI0012F0F7BF|nr:glycosyltransferase [Microbacterium sp. 8M]VXB12389.1 Galactofuranosyl transferase GlfT2 [Microbacterium sp. 8M]
MTHVLQHVVFPLERDPDLLPLYMDPETWATIGGASVRVSARAHIGDVLDRRSVRVGRGRRVSFASYFNAFPASYWQHWTTVEAVRLTVRTRGRATIIVYRSNGDGIRQRVESRAVDAEAEESFDIRLDRFSDGGWIWFDLVADREDTILESAHWSTDHEPVRTGLASLGITTYNKPEYCIRTLEALADAPEVMKLVDRIFLIDQGDQRVESRSEFPEISSRLGDALQVIAQPNLGGSGGFSRAMLETLKRPDSGFVQLLDDDVRIEPEALRRSITFGRYASTPTLVGAHMFDLLDRTSLHAWAEVVDEGPFMWRRLFEDDMPHDFSESNLRQNPTLHMRLDAGYNGWWMCLIPVEAIRAVGLAMPAFIKWDDAEFCLRAGEAGFPTVSLPGVALWHVAWVGKDDQIDWQAYFHARNRIVAALLHSTAPRGGALLKYSRRVDLKHLMSMQYYPTALRMQALRDVLSGPEHMRRDLATAMPTARAIAADYAETVVHVSSERPIRTVRGRLELRRSRRRESAPTGLRLRWITASSLVSHWFRAPRPHHRDRPEAEFGKSDAQWWRLARYDSALVSTADGTGHTVYRRDRATHRALMRESAELHAELRRRWPDLQKTYRAHLSELVSADAWRTTFEGRS